MLRHETLATTFFVQYEEEMSMKEKIKSMDFIAQSVRKCFQCFERMDLETRHCAPTPYTDRNERIRIQIHSHTACTHSELHWTEFIYYILLIAIVTPHTPSLYSNSPSFSTARIALLIWPANVLRTPSECVIGCVRQRRKFDFQCDRLLKLIPCVWLVAWLAVLSLSSESIRRNECNIIVYNEAFLCWSLMVCFRRTTKETTMRPSHTIDLYLFNCVYSQSTYAYRMT